jgi:S-adenosylmethionine/arginine decarboxylase-like enzyme
MVFGKHIIIDANECNENNIKNIDIIDIFIEKLCNVGNMTRKGDLIVEVFPESDFNIKNDLVGFSVVQIISLSNITLHINFISRTVYFDFFTCGEIKEDRIIDIFYKYFNPKTIKKIILERDAIDTDLPFIVGLPALI